MAHPYNVILFSDKKGTDDTCYNMDEAQKYLLSEKSKTQKNYTLETPFT